MDRLSTPPQPKVVERLAPLSPISAVKEEKRIAALSASRTIRKRMSPPKKPPVAVIGVQTMEVNIQESPPETPRQISPVVVVAEERETKAPAEIVIRDIVLQIPYRRPPEAPKYVPAPFEVESFGPVDCAPEGMTYVFQVGSPKRPVRAAEFGGLVLDIPTLTGKFHGAQPKDGDKLECQTIKPRAKRVERMDPVSPEPGSHASPNELRTVFRTIRYI
jgi:hypothetical protein